jgi:hypothetical protein
MLLQSLIVFMLVTGCFMYAAWTLMPQSVRRLLGRGLLRLPLPEALRSICQKADSAAVGCHCSGCDRATVKRGASQKTEPIAAKPVVFHPRRG